MIHYMPTSRQKSEDKDPRAKSRCDEGLRAKIGWKLRFKNVERQTWAGSVDEGHVKP